MFSYIAGSCNTQKKQETDNNSDSLKQYSVNSYVID